MEKMLRRRAGRFVARWAAAGLVCAALVVVTGQPASAATIGPTRSAADLAGALADSLAPGVLTGSSLPVIPPPPNATIECANGLDDDVDGFVDFTPPIGSLKDPGCASATDNLEQDDAPPECANGFDDDGDLLVDFMPPTGETADPGCASASDNNEVEGAPDPIPACANGFDDDGDGLVDFTPPTGQTTDPGCESAGDLDEGSEGLPVGVDSNPAAVVSSPLAGFPTSGSTFTTLSSGNTLFADHPNDSTGTSQSNNGGGGTHGASFLDLVTLKLDVTVPTGANCLSLDFRFLSEEFPEFVGSAFNDGFIAELDGSDFTAAADLTINAPRNFAFDATGKVVSINTAGFSLAEAAGTTYDGSTPLLRASTPVTTGPHSVYLSVFDQGDSALDSSALLDNLRTFTAPTGGCSAGATADLTPPDTTITAGPTGTISNTTPQFSFTSTEPGTFQCRVDGGPWTSCTSPFTTDPLANGSHTFDVRAIDNAGNIDPTPDTRSFTVSTTDLTPPDTTITAGPAGPTADSTPTFSFTATEAGSTFECRVDSGVFASCATPFTSAVLAEGAHTFEVRATDAAGNTDGSPASRSFTVDTAPPDTTITAGPSGLTSDSTPTFSFTATEAGSTFQCRLDGAAFGSCSTPFTTAVLADGAHTFEVRATDAAGNTDASPASRSFTVDTTPPDTTITAGPTGTTNDSTPTFSFTSTVAGSTFQCRLDGAAFGSCSTPFTTAVLADGAHTFEVRATDAAGNTDFTPASRAFTVSTVVPPPPPPPPPPTQTCDGKTATIVGTAGADVLTGTDANDVIVALGGADVINGGGGNDTICGGDGNDAITGGGGKDSLDGGTGHDKLNGGGGKDALEGGTGNDKLVGTAGDDTLTGGAGDDRLKGGGGDDNLSGQAGDDHLDGGPGRDQGSGGGGIDVILRCET